MKVTGIVRKLDELGRIVIPIGLRRSLGINERDAIEFYVEGENIILHQYQPTCTFCGEVAETSEYKGKTICSNCANEMKTLLASV